MRLSKIPEDKKAPPADDDLPYVAACRKGDTEAFAVLVERHSRKMLNIACRMLDDYDEACDVTQEAFLAAFRAIGKFKAEAKFSTWLCRIVINYSKNRLKMRQSLSKRESVSLEDIAEGREGCPACQAAAAGGNPQDKLEQREIDEHVQRCISALDVEYRDVLVLRDIQGFSYEEIRVALKVPEGTVKSRLSRARLAMKDCLRKIMGDL